MLLCYLSASPALHIQSMLQRTLGILSPTALDSGNSHSLHFMSHLSHTCFGKCFVKLTDLKGWVKSHMPQTVYTSQCRCLSGFSSWQENQRHGSWLGWLTGNTWIRWSLVLLHFLSVILIWRMQNHTNAGHWACTKSTQAVYYCMSVLCIQFP